MRTDVQMEEIEGSVKQNNHNESSSARCKEMHRSESARHDDYSVNNRSIDNGDDDGIINKKNTDVKENKCTNNGDELLNVCSRVNREGDQGADLKFDDERILPSELIKDLRIPDANCADVDHDIGKLILDGSDEGKQIVYSLHKPFIRKKYRYLSHELAIETGRLANNTDASILISFAGINILCTIVIKEAKASAVDGDIMESFLPLTVQYQERLYASGRMPTTAVKRENKQSNREILISRVIDRAVRPLISAEYKNEIQIISTLLSANTRSSLESNSKDACTGASGKSSSLSFDYNGQYCLDFLALIAASVALGISSIPHIGHFGVYKNVIDSENYIANNMTVVETYSLLATGVNNAITMMEGNFREISASDFACEIERAHVAIAETQEIIGDFISEYRDNLRSYADLKKMSHEGDFSMEERLTNKNKYGESLAQDLKSLDVMDEIFAGIHDYRQIKDVIRGLTYELRAQNNVIDDKAAYALAKNMLMNYMWKNNTRFDGRGFADIRAINCSVQPEMKQNSRAGAGLFSRLPDSTQVLAFVNYGSGTHSNEYDIEYSVFGPKMKRCILNYNFWPFAVNDVGQVNRGSRREIGHGELARKALLPVLMDKVSVRISAEVLNCAGSSLAGTVCASSIALANSGFSTSGHVGAIAMGAIRNIEGAYTPIADMNDMEDQYCSAMDFKIAGTKMGITAVQLDVKSTDIQAKFLLQASAIAQEKIRQIIDDMTIAAPISGARRDTNDSANYNVNNGVRREFISADSIYANNESSSDNYSISIPLSRFKSEKIQRGSDKMKMIEEKLKVKMTAISNNLMIVGNDQESVDEAVHMILSIFDSRRDNRDNRDSRENRDNRDNRDNRLDSDNDDNDLPNDIMSAKNKDSERDANIDGGRYPENASYRNERHQRSYSQGANGEGANDSSVSSLNNRRMSAQAYEQNVPDPSYAQRSRNYEANMHYNNNVKVANYAEYNHSNTNDNGDSHRRNNKNDKRDHMRKDGNFNYGAIDNAMSEGYGSYDSTLPNYHHNNARNVMPATAFDQPSLAPRSSQFAPQYSKSQRSMSRDDLQEVDRVHGYKNRREYDDRRRANNLSTADNRNNNGGYDDYDRYQQPEAFSDYDSRIRHQRRNSNARPHNIEIGGRYSAKITRIVQYGLFARIDDVADGLVHLNEINIPNMDNLQNTFYVGQIIPVSVLQIEKNGKLKLSYIDDRGGVSPNNYSDANDRKNLQQKRIKRFW